MIKLPEKDVQGWICVAVLVIVLIVCSSVARAETIYIQIPILPDNPIFTPEDFAADYLATAGEIFVLMNMQEAAGVRMMTGTTVCTEAQAAELKSRWPMMSWYKQLDQEYPPGWIQKISESQ